MIIDCHTHLYSSQRGNLAQEHLEICQRLDGCFVMAGLSDDRQSVNQDLVDYVSGSSKAYGFATYNPVQDDVSLKGVRKATRDRGLCGVVFYCAENAFHPAHSRAMQFYEAAEELGLIVFFHNCPPYSPQSVLDFAQPWLLDEVARRFPNLKIIIGRMGMPFYWQTEGLLAKHKNIYADLSVHPQRIWQTYNLVLSAYEAGIMDKLLFGSGFPFARPDACIETLLGFNRLLADTHLPQVPREKLRSIVERDTLKLFGLK
ncbi:MAG TPA: amidohydrolase family protein [Anaerohalosphaeraceae bacterium]|nr:amidohydrolase family protein [Phycisphaerae bacterium]HPC64088.1 amidohydrolase family protein [Anaerohalosphaeraceae bacterium]